MKQIALALLILLPATVLAGGRMPRELEGVKFDPILKEQLPLDVPFRDDQGKAVTLADYCDGGQTPVVLAFVQYRCPMLCNLILEGLVDSLKRLARERGFYAGEHFRVVVLSFDHREDADLSAAKKAACVEAYAVPGTEGGWHFLTGEKDAIQKVTEKGGFSFRYDAKTEQFAHDSGILVLTPKGKISRYFFGIEYEPQDLYYGLVEASTYRIGKPVLDRAVLLFCYSYDPAKGTYQFAVMNVVRWASLLTILLLGGFVVVLLRRERKKKLSLGGV